MSVRIAFALLAGMLVSCAATSPERKTEARTINLLGRFSYPMNRPDLAASLEKLGNTVSSSMTAAVDLVIVGHDILDSSADGFVPVTALPEYKEAQNRGLELVTIARLRERFPALQGPGMAAAPSQ